jgi:CheY-like chemotaxis protein
LQLIKVECEKANVVPQWVEMMERQLKQMVRLVDDLLDVSRVLSGKIALQLQRADLREVVRYAAEGCSERMQQQRHALTVELPRDSVWVDVDDVRLQQVIANLLNNAAKFTPPGGHIALRVGTEREEAVLRVIDDGPGIPRELLPHVFDLFMQGERTLDRSSGGLGIGLTLANNLVHLHGGYIQAFSEGEGRGSEFVVRLPLRAGAAVPITNVIDLADEVETPRRILVVDDNEDMANSTAAILQLWGHQVMRANSGPAAIERLDAFKPDTVLLDIGLPDMDGYAVAQRIRELPEMAATTLIGVSGYGAENYKRRAFEVGFDEYFVKPLDLNKLRNYLNRLPALH